MSQEPSRKLKRIISDVKKRIAPIKKKKEIVKKKKIEEIPLLTVNLPTPVLESKKEQLNSVQNQPKPPIKRRPKKFTAAYANEKAIPKAMAIFNSLTENEKVMCDICEGTGRMSFCKKSISLENGNIVEKDKGKSSIKCFECKNTGKLSTKEKLDQIHSKCIWCECENSSDSATAKDGRNVFGNDTYVCVDCGMVVQFG